MRARQRQQASEGKRERERERQTDRQTEKEPPLGSDGGEEEEERPSRPLYGSWWSRKQNGSSLVVTGNGRGVERKLVIHGYTLPSLPLLPLLPGTYYVYFVIRARTGQTRWLRSRKSRAATSLVISFPSGAHRRPFRSSRLPF